MNYYNKIFLSAKQMIELIANGLDASDASAYYGSADVENDDIILRESSEPISDEFIPVYSAHELFDKLPGAITVDGAEFFLMSHKADDKLVIYYENSWGEIIGHHSGEYLSVLFEVTIWLLKCGLY